ncbi:peptidoglycan editing factor PgeF [Bacillus andreraoultii]|uniref:peptidoglycan editing factor PgeF n=1 Tax=Bacillus andreraoultii TaxID=1499685 RepID=UPI000539824B|nr:peptidoglycan editing factor PgeF [Bacillus andreraoultii]
MKEPFHFVDESYYLIHHWQKINPQVVAGFTTKNGGTSSEPYESNNFGFHVGDQQEKVVQNRKRLAQKINFPLENWVSCEQTHGINIYQVTERDKGKGSSLYSDSIKDCDGIFTDQNHILLTLMYADCVPIFFLAPENNIGIVHAGWKGTVNNIVRSFIEQWRKSGIRKETIHVTIGPSICNKCYIVDNKVIKEVQKLPIDNAQSCYEQIEENQYRIDLKELNRLLLLKEGIKQENILVTSLCSSCNDTHFFSHRRDHGRTGRMMGFIGIREEKN